MNGIKIIDHSKKTNNLGEKYYVYRFYSVNNKDFKKIR